MEPTTLFSQIIGVYMLIAGASVLLQPARAEKAIKNAAKNPVIPYFDGALAIIAGLFIVSIHNMWDGLQASVVTAIGWISLIAGTAELLASEKVLSRMFAWCNTPAGRYGMGIASLVIGAYLTYVGFIS